MSTDQGGRAALENFLDHFQLLPSYTWVIAFSGGLDSSLLLQAFIDIALANPQKLPSKIVVAHFDHGWRPESAAQALELADYVKQIKAPLTEFCFETQRCRDFVKGVNLEAFAREARYNFLQCVAANHHASVVFLAHQKNDHHETVFKNILEGKELAFLSGLKPLTKRGQLLLARPFLRLDRQMLQAEAKARGIEYCQDPTNQDTRFLRARFREVIAPHLDAHWPKSWKKGLEQISRYSEEIFEELHSWLEEHVLASDEGILGFRFLLKEQDSSNRCIWRLRFGLRQLSAPIACLGKEGSASLARAWLEKKRAFAFEAGRWRWQMEFPYLFVIEKHSDLNAMSAQDLWQIAPCSCKSTNKRQWHDIWSGSFMITATDVNTKLLLIKDLDAQEQTKWRSYYQKQKVPSFLRPLIPFVRSANGTVVSVLKSQTATSAQGSNLDFSLKWVGPAVDKGASNI